ncbi:hypothetical protein ABZ307_27320 [Streptomyces griseorubiginosus]|uniref:hypothetical protein n=1 Tax=Streptomyces griseorubiginosus TaxID=67304 RepID=UPI0033B8C256
MDPNTRRRPAGPGSGIRKALVLSTVLLLVRQPRVFASGLALTRADTPDVDELHD